MEVRKLNGPQLYEACHPIPKEAPTDTSYSNGLSNRCNLTDIIHNSDSKAHVSQPPVDHVIAKMTTQYYSGTTISLVQQQKSPLSIRDFASARINRPSAITPIVRLVQPIVLTGNGADLIRL